MQTDRNTAQVGELLAHPLILQGAWMRVRSWYSRGELAPQPELSVWELHPERMLSELAELLRNDEWKPESWLQVPYPKKGQRLRHYLKPTVRDQVAFMVHLVALGPILDHQIENFAFGNRWYRPIAWDRRKSVKQRRWFHRSYPLLTEHTYLPYARSHGLFRRVAHWTVARMTRTPLLVGDVSSRRPQIEDYADDTLPSWTRSDWWEEFSPDDSKCAYWAALDIELAFPSVRLERLDKALKRALSVEVGKRKISDLFEGYPDTVLNSLVRSDVRVEIGKRLIDALKRIKVKKSEIPTVAWQQQDIHGLPKISIDQFDGLPTGLIVSGILLNVVLQNSDVTVRRFLEKTRTVQPSAFLRFADDMYVLSSSRNGLLALIEEVDRALSGTTRSNFAVPNTSSNLSINFKKIFPDAVKDVLEKYLLHNGWNQCHKCTQPLAPQPNQTDALSISEWLSTEANSEELLQHLNTLDRTAIRQGDIGPFVTSLVELMSDMGRDTPRHRFGEGSRNYLARLHELARFNIDDQQVRPDTLRMFSINRLVRAWLPRQQDGDEERQELGLIRETISFTLNTMPWKFSAWRAIVRAGARRAKSQSSDHEEILWLSNQIRRIACTTNNVESSSWLTSWPESDKLDPHIEEQKNEVRSLYLSYLRAAFWQSLATTIRDLRKHANNIKDTAEDLFVLSPDRWTVRAVPEGRHGEVADSLSRLDLWVEILYPNFSEQSLEEWPWELDEFVKCVFAVHSMSELTKAWQSSSDQALTLKMPRTTKLNTLPNTQRVLCNSKRLQDEKPRVRSRLDRNALAQIRLGFEDEKFESVLLPKRGTSWVVESADCPSDFLAITHNLRCYKRVRLDVAKRVLPSAAEAALSFSRDVLKFQDYVRSRRVIVGQHACRVERPTIHRLLWGNPFKSQLSDWNMSQWETPAVGFPVRVAAKLFIAARTQNTDVEWKPEKGPYTWQLEDVNNVLAYGRRGQFFQTDEPVKTSQTLRVTKTTIWEICPNVAFYRPFLVVCSSDICTDSYSLYCDVLLFLTALCGDERILDRLASRGIGGTPFEDRWEWRAQIHLPRQAWRLIEKILRWSDKPSTNIASKSDQLLDSLNEWANHSIKWNDFLPERIDVGLEPRTDLDIVRAISRTGELSIPNLPKELDLNKSQLCEELLVRVGQTDAWPKSKKVVVKTFPTISSDDASAMIEQVCNVFLAPKQTTYEAPPGLVVLPELAIPQQEIHSLRSLVKNENQGVVAGLFWRYVRSAFKPSKEFKSKWRCIVNEAELVLPIQEKRGPSFIRWFRVQKPVPAHVEIGLSNAISRKDPKAIVLPGRRWYRFVHPSWGDFSIGICSDLIDSSPWRALRSELLHLFMVAFNKDVELFDSLTWIRAYENYVNVVSVNHGKFGGSFIWTPKSKHSKELARLRGSDLVLTADVRMPVKSLFVAQVDGVQDAIRRETCRWLGHQQDFSEFKAPPPGYLERKSQSQ